MKHLAIDRYDSERLTLLSDTEKVLDLLYLYSFIFPFLFVIALCLY